MSDNKLTPKQLDDLAKDIRRDQEKTKPAEKRVRVNATFDKAIKKMGQTPPPKKKAK